jgi:hypothetical protein
VVPSGRYRTNGSGITVFASLHWERYMILQALGAALFLATTNGD